MYTIYEIPGVKVGCTNRSPEIRVKEQGYSEYRILELLEDLSSASQRERYWQEKLGYKTDYVLYTTTKKFLDKCNTPTGRSNWKKSIKGSQKWRKARDNWSKDRIKQILQYNLQGDLISEWPDAKTAATSLNTSIVNIRGCLLGKQKTAAGFIWRYKNLLSEIS